MRSRTTVERISECEGQLGRFQADPDANRALREIAAEMATVVAQTQQVENYISASV